MNIEDYLKDGRLIEAIELQNEEVRKNPTDIEKRYLLFTLLAFAGNLERAMKQLDVLAKRNEELAMGCRMYQNLIVSEESRLQAFSGKSKPIASPNSKPHVLQRVDAFFALHSGDKETYVKTMEEIGEAGCALKGKVNDEAFSGIMDYDSLLGPVLEVFAGGRYLWMPFDEIKKIEIQEPANMIDLLWIQAKILSKEEDSYEAHLPALYAGSHAQEDQQIRLGRSTMWEEVSDGLFRGYGQKTLLVAMEEEDKEIPLLSLRTVEFD